MSVIEQGSPGIEAKHLTLSDRMRAPDKHHSATIRPQ
jgi:hypothetical protein